MRTTSNLDSPDKCPNLNCGKVQEVRGIDFDNPRAPASIGGDVRIRAVDETARIVMEDHGLTDLRSDQRPGDTAAPRLRPDLQARADNMFAKPKINGHNMPRIDGGMLGRFHDPKTPDVMGAISKARWRPPVNIIADYGGNK